MRPVHLDDTLSGVFWQEFADSPSCYLLISQLLSAPA